jgi:predicted membrane-bound spermidine synthase
MAVELMGTKLLAPFYGSSLYVWTAILCITVLGLTLGYYFGGRLSEKHASEKILVLILSLAALLVFALPNSATLLISMTSTMRLIPGICTASFFLLVPPMFCFGLVGPMVVRLMARKMETLGNVAGTVYFTSTLGGILATFLFGFYWIPEMGLKFCALITALALAALPVIFILKSFIPAKSSGFQVPDSGFQVPKPKQLKIQNSKFKTHNSIYLYAALEGATVMAVELMAARMLAPWFGSSLYVWSAVIGITLLSLALGYFAGGKLADKFAQLNTIHWVILSASVFLVLMNSTSQYLTVVFAEMDLRISVVVVSLLLILPPLLFLGMVPTLLIRYLTDKVENAGTTTGRVFTISSASGIMALPLLGFFVIPAFGLVVPSIIIGLLVGVVPMIHLLGQKKYLSLFLALFMFLSLSQRKVNGLTPDLKVLSYSEGLLGQVLVADIFKNGAGAAINDRMLFINRMGQTNINKTTNTSKWNYITFITALASKLPENSDALVLGLGGGSAANIFQTNLKFRVDAVELDGRIGEVARQYFQLNTDVKVIVDDARHYLETTKKTYDLIFFDVFKGETQPPHVLTIECFTKAKSLLNKDGFLIVNFHGFLSDETGKPGRSVYSTLQATGFETHIFPTPGKEEDRNTLFIATVGKQGFNNVRYPLLHLGKQVGLDSLFLDSKTLNMKSSVVFTDDKPDLDRMNMEANSIWRKSYNATYSKFFLENGVPMFK